MRTYPMRCPCPVVTSLDVCRWLTLHCISVFMPSVRMAAMWSPSMLFTLTTIEREGGREGGRERKTKREGMRREEG